MRIGIVGVGAVGSAVKYGFEKLGHTVKCHDIAMDSSIADVLDTELVFICVPTPQRQDGGCNTSIVQSVVCELVDSSYGGCVAIKSTVEPTTTEDISHRYGIKVCFVPEFLRERCAISDFIENHDLLAVGCHDTAQYDLIVQAHGHFPKSVVRMLPTEAELLKYYSNTFNAMKVVFANTMYEVSEKLGIDYQAVKSAFIQRGTASDMYLDVNENFRGYGGVCLPKDTSAMACFVKNIGLNLGLFETLRGENSKFKTTVLEGMRPQ